MCTATTGAPTQREPELLGQTVVVIGGTAGSELETARRARAEGAKVILTGRDAASESRPRPYRTDRDIQIARQISSSTTTRRISHEAQRQAHDCDSHGSARRPRRHCRLRAGQVLAEIAERYRVLRLQGIRGLGCRLFLSD